MEKEKLESILFRRIDRLLEEYKVHAPAIIIKQELLLISDACTQLSSIYDEELKEKIGEE